MHSRSAQFPFFRYSGFWYYSHMELAKLGKKGQLSIPKSILNRLGIEGEALLAVDVTDDGSILLRQVGVYPLEVYSDARVAEFAEADEISPEEAEKVAARRD